MKKMLLLGVVIIGLLLSSCSKNYDEYLDQATELQKTANYEEALEALDHAIKQAETADQRVTANITAGNLGPFFSTIS